MELRFKSRRFRLFVFFAVITTVLFQGCARKERPLPASEIPMYGGETSSAAITEDTRQNQAMVLKTGSREAAFKKIFDQGLASYQRGYFELAMHHYNRAWLLDPKNPEVFNGFGLVLDAQGKGDEALKIYEKYLELNPHHPMTLSRLARHYQDKAVWLASGPPEAGEDPDVAAKPYFEKALLLYKEALDHAALEIDKSFISYQWAIALAIKKDYTGAWKKVHESKKHGGQFIEQKFIQTLTQDMPEPSQK